jgi:hypothetical protein
VNPNKYLVDYLVHSYLYYIKGTSLITDYQFDSIALNLRDTWDKVDHPHKYLVIKESLDAGTSAYYIKDYPSIVKSVTEGLLNGSIKL